MLYTKVPVLLSRKELSDCDSSKNSRHQIVVIYVPIPMPPQIWDLICLQLSRLGRHTPVAITRSHGQERSGPNWKAKGSDKPVFERLRGRRGVQEPTGR